MLVFQFQGYSQTFSGSRDILRLFQTWNPDGLFRLVRLVLVRLLHVHAGKQELGGIGVDRTLHQLDVARHDGAEILPEVKISQNIKSLILYGTLKVGTASGKYL